MGTKYLEVSNTRIGIMLDNLDIMQKNADESNDKSDLFSKLSLIEWPD